jgi:hypothetical protein
LRLGAETGRRIDKAAPGAQHERHEQNTSATPSTSRRDADRFEQAVEAIAGGSADTGGGFTPDQVRQLIDWAKASECLIDEAAFEALPLVSDETGEHEVRFREEDRRVVKKTWTGTFGMVPEWSPEGWRPGSATPLEYLRRFILHNHLFQDDVRLEGVINSAIPATLVGAEGGGCSLVISQRWLVADDPENPHPSLEEIAAFMQELGFDTLPDSFFGWYRAEDSVLVLDAKADNFVKTPDGILPFDLVLARVEA